MANKIDFSKLDDVYKNKMSMVMKNLGQDITIYYPAERMPDRVYRWGKEPDFKSEPTRDSETIRVICRFDTSDAENYKLNLSDEQTAIKVKCKKGDQNKLRRADYILVDTDKYKMVRDPIPHGFLETRYYISWWTSA